MFSGMRTNCALFLVVFLFLVFGLGLGMASAQSAPPAGSNAANEMPSVTTVPPEAQPSAQLQRGRGHRRLHGAHTRQRAHP